jgi:rod shape-determining protein MreD
MHKWPIIIIGSALLTTFQAAFFSALPAPAYSIDLLLVVIIGFIAGFRPRYAYAAAITGGLVQDVLSSSSPGMHILIAILAVFVLNLLFERIITNLSFISFAALNAVGFTIYWTAAAAMNALVDLTLGRPLGWSFASSAAALFLGMILQVAVGLSILLIFKNLARFFRMRFIFSEHA